MIKIQRVQADDILSVINLAYNTLPERYNPSIFNHFYELYPDGFLVAFYNHNLIGFIIGIKTIQNTARILMLCVNETCRKKGVGSDLLQQFLSYMKNQNVRRFELEVRTTNKIAIEFYLKHGFIIQEILHQFYQYGEDAYKMKLDL